MTRGPGRGLHVPSLSSPEVPSERVPMHEEHEAELRMALAEGLISREEADALREDARRLGKSPLALLKERGVVSDASLAALHQVDDESTVTRAPPAGADTLGPAL